MTAIDPASGVSAPRLKLTTALAGLALTSFIHVAGAIWWAAAMTQRANAMEQTIGPLRDGSIQSILAKLDERTARMDKRSDRMADRLERIEARQISGSRP